MKKILSLIKKGVNAYLTALSKCNYTPTGTIPFGIQFLYYRVDSILQGLCSVTGQHKTFAMFQRSSNLTKSTLFHDYIKLQFDPLFGSQRLKKLLYILSIQRVFWVFSSKVRTAFLQREGHQFDSNRNSKLWGCSWKVYALGC